MESEQQREFSEACGFIDGLVMAMQSYGVSSRSMVANLSRAVRALGLHGEFIATPNYVQTVLWGEDEHQQRVHLAVSRSGAFNLAKLARVNDLTQQVEAGTLRPTEGIRRLQEIRQAPDAYGPLARASAFMLSAACFGIVMGASWLDVLLAGVVALVSYGIARVAERYEGVAALQEFLAGMSAAVLANVGAALVPGVDASTITLCAIIWFIPGFGLTIAPSELIAGNTLSGIMWLTNAAVALLKLFVGTGLGAALARGVHLAPKMALTIGATAPAWKWVAVPVFVIALAILMKGEQRSFLRIVLGGWLVWGAWTTGLHVGAWLGAFLGAAAVMIYAHWISNRFRLPSGVIILPCAMILVPGSATLKALYVADTEGILAGFSAAYDVLVILAAITGGVIVGDALALRNLVKTGAAVKAIIGRPYGQGPKGKAR